MTLFPKSRCCPHHHALRDHLAQMRGHGVALPGEVHLVASAMVGLRVVDHGPGVPGDERERIFDRFRRGHDARGRTGSGRRSIR